ncbi:MAG: HAD hydrolase-like protein, partial [Pseudomonadota bacterium]
ALAQVFEEEGGKVIYPGKPHAPIYELALSKLADLRVEAASERTLCIGDSPATDMRGALNQSFHGLYVGTGLKEHGANFEHEVADLLTDYSVTAKWAMPKLTW